MKIRAEIDAGVCGLRTCVSASCSDGRTVRLCIESDCPRVKQLAQGLAVMDAVDEVLREPLSETTPVALAAQHGLHASCVVPVGILKAVEAAAGLALPATSAIEVARAE